jgi:hypothetical protein
MNDFSPREIVSELAASSSAWPTPKHIAAEICISASRNVTIEKL